MRVCVTPAAVVIALAAVLMVWSVGFGIYLSAKGRG